MTIVHTGMAGVGDVAAAVAQARVPRWYTGQIVAQNIGDGTYQVWIKELNVIFPRVARSGPDKRRLADPDRVTIRQLGVVMEIL